MPSSRESWSASPAVAGRNSGGAGPCEAEPISARAVHHDGLAAGVQLAFLLQLLEHAPGHLARAADDARELLAGDADLRALRVAHRVGFEAQVTQRARDAAGDIEERQAAGLAAGIEQALGQDR